MLLKKVTIHSKGFNAPPPPTFSTYAACSYYSQIAHNSWLQPKVAATHSLPPLHCGLVEFIHELMCGSQ